ncbi:ABC transporter substrate-binding protein [Lysinibacter cavernae]|uniref:Peptide/nickel transport system substrate-binding protein n=1 Tax=Lysinibacter cavernae TaxID=1640652 RepID=A0A7X5QZ35_9MICO|nr:ABC transporter substrate-binding protein [Lysinibacter cavernae]NIH52586.1 peptide/nickel transport system substrate-binding protein [Lysinibacter cavernae]
MKNRILTATLAAVAVTTLVAGCSAPTGPTGANADTVVTGEASTIRYALWSSPNGTFHPELYFTDYDRAIIFNVYSRLVTLDEQQGFKPSLAESYDFSEDGKTLTLKLKEGVKWHDGKDFTAEDVAFTYSAIADAGWPTDTPEFATYLEGFEAYNSGAADSVSGIKVVDPTTVSFSFTTPYLAALAYFADRPVLAKHVWESTPVAQWNDATELLNNPVGTGPYKFVEFVPDQHVTLVRNEDYFGGTPQTENLIFKVSNQETAQTEILNGDLDIAELSSFNEDDLSTYTDAGVNIVEQTGVGGQYLTLDTTDSRLSDERVRQALVYGINRQGLVDSLLYGHGELFNTNAHPDDPAYPTGLNEYAYDPKKAKKLLSDAGWTDSDGDGILDKNGEKFTFTINFPTGNKTRERSAPIIQQNLKDLGIEAELVSADFNSTLSILQNPETEFDGVLMGGTFRPGKYDNDFWWERYQDAELDSLSEQINSTVDPKEQQGFAGEWLTSLNEKAIRVWLYSPNIGYAVNPAVTGYSPYPYEPFANIVDWAVTAN